jgi:eukaryotic-like serine/threonine-protein kinase
LIGQVISHYQILSERGGGGQGKVYVAEDLHLKRQVAVKFPQLSPGDEQQHARFLREARLAAELNHPHIARIYDYGETDDHRPYLVMELVKGDPLGRSYHKLSMARAVEVMQEVTEALAAAHRLGIIHRDIKPGNIMINDRDEVKVLDFGLAKRIGEPVSITLDSIDLTIPSQLSKPGNIAGTPQYMSPEQASGDYVDARTDLFSVGIVLYECLTGIVPFPGRDLGEILMSVKTLDPPPPSKQNPMVPPELDRIVGKALKKLPADRYQTADELSADLRAARTRITDGEAATIKQAISEPDTKATRVVDTIRKTARYTVRTVLMRPGIAVPVLFVAIAAIVLALWYLTTPSPVDRGSIAKGHYDRGLAALLDGAYYRASSALEGAVKSDRTYAEAHLRLADAWLQLDQNDKAGTELLLVSEFAPGMKGLPKIDTLYHQALTSMVNGNFGAAVEHYRQIVKEAPKEEQLHARLSLAKALEKDHQTENEKRTYLEAVQMFAHPAAWLKLGTYYARQNKEVDRARDAFDQADALYGSDSEGKTEVDYQRGLFLLRLGNMEEARKQLERASLKARVNENKSQEILAQLLLGDVAFNQGQLDQADTYVREAVQLAKDRGLETVAGRGLIKLGDQALNRGDYRAEGGGAEDYYNQALQLAKKTRGGAEYVEALSLFQLASLRQKQGRLQEALDNLKRPIEFFARSGYGKDTALALTLQARLNRDRGEYDEAVKADKSLLAEAVAVGNGEQQVLSHIDLGKLFALQENYPDALAHAIASYEIAGKLGKANWFGYSLADIGEMQRRLGRYSEATETLNRFDQLKDLPGDLSAQVLMTRAEMALCLHDSAKAIDFAKSALKEAPNDSETRIHGQEVIGLARIRQGAVADGRLLCEAALRDPKLAGNPSLVSFTSLAAAEALVATRDTTAVTFAVEAAKRFEQQGQRDSAWRSYGFAAWASKDLGNHATTLEYTRLADEQLKKLESSWLAADYRSYINRPDIKGFLARLRQIQTQSKQ